jgi:hypothetical protein
MCNYQNPKLLLAGLEKNKSNYVLQYMTTLRSGFLLFKRADKSLNLPEIFTMFFVYLDGFSYINREAILIALHALMPEEYIAGSYSA